jgi:hypothetical protein
MECKYCKKNDVDIPKESVYFCSDICFKIYTDQFNVVFDRHFMEPGLRLTVIDEINGEVTHHFNKNWPKENE